MTISTTRKTFLKRAAGGAVGAALAGDLVEANAAQAAAGLDASFTSPYPPHPQIAYPSSWNVYTALVPGVVAPMYNVVICNRQLKPLPDIDGVPDPRAIPSDATMLLLYQNQIPADSDVSLAKQLNGTTMNFSDLSGGSADFAGYRHFSGWWVATVDGNLQNFQVWVFVGPNAGAEWTTVQAIIDSIELGS